MKDSSPIFRGDVTSIYNSGLKIALFDWGDDTLELWLTSDGDVYLYWGREEDAANYKKIYIPSSDLPNDTSWEEIKSRVNTLLTLYHI